MKLSGSDAAEALFGLCVLTGFAVLINLIMSVLFPVDGVMSLFRAAAAAFRLLDLYILLLPVLAVAAAAASLFAGLDHLRKLGSSRP